MPSVRVDSDAVDRRSRLITAAAPVLKGLAEQLGDSPYLVILADRDSRIVEIPIGSRTLRRRVDALGGTTGALFLEETTGTNSIATVHELRQAVAVHGVEHYLEPFKALSCYGHPIIHPVTRRLGGVLDITCLTKDDSPLLGPLIARAANDIEERLLSASRRGEQQMLAVFQSATSGHNRPVVAMGTGVVLANPAATDLLDSVDHIHLRRIAEELSSRHSAGTSKLFDSIALASGQVVSVRARLVEPGLRGVLFEFVTADPHAAVEKAGAAVDTAVAAAPAAGNPVYVGGSPGSGRTSTARRLAGRHPVIEFDAASVAASGEAAWLTRLESAVAADPGVLIVEHIELLPRLCAVRLAAISRRSVLGTIYTGAAPSELPGHVAPLAAACSTHLELRELTARLDELPGLVRDMLNELGVVDRLRFTPSALAALAACSWPGNLRELRTVVGDVARRRATGDITALDLPERYRRSPRWRSMSPLERAEHDAIVAALRSCEGNKMRAAQQLGISRTTLYNRIRALRVSA